MTKIHVPLGLGVVIELDAPDGADRAAIAAFVHAVVDQIGLKVADVTGDALAALARLDAAVEVLGEGELTGRQRSKQADGVRLELRRVRDMLRPINMELWGSAFRRRIDAFTADQRRAQTAKLATAAPAALAAPRVDDGDHVCLRCGRFFADLAAHTCPGESP